MNQIRPTSVSHRNAATSLDAAACSSARSLVQALIATVIAITLLSVASARGDDRELLRERGSDPYVFVLFDTSGSMNQTPVCTAADTVDDIDPWDGACTFECPMDEDVCQQVCPDVGCLNFSDTDLLPPIDIQIDDGAATLVGSWSLENPTGAFGGSAMTTPLASGATATYQHTFAETRSYRVSISVPQSATWAKNVTVTVSGTVDGAAVIVDQRTPVQPPPDPDDPPAPPYEPWFLVGTYEFQAGTTGTFEIRAFNTNGPVVVDGIRFESIVKDCEPGRDTYVCRQPVCPNGDCFVPLFGDDPGSKFFQAKQAMYEVLDTIRSVRFGFATFEQDMLQIFAKKWAHRTRAFELNGTTPETFFTLPGGTQFPRAGDLEVFGQTALDAGNFWWGCPFNRPGCTYNLPASLSNPTERAFIGGLPKVGERLSRPTTVWVRETPASTDVFRVIYSAASPTLGGPTFEANIQIDRCTSSACNPPAASLGSLTISYDLISDFLGLDGRYANGTDHILWSPTPPNDTDPNNVPPQFIPGCGHPTANGNTGWDPNDDSGSAFANFFADYTVDKSINYNARYPTTSDPRSNSGNQRAFDFGDVIPWDWEDGAEHIDELQARLAPNSAVPATTAKPDFRVARYLNDLPLDTDFPTHPIFRQLRWTDDNQRALVPRGFTPLGYSMDNIRRWYLEFSAEAGQVTGQDGDGEDLTQDPDWTCRDKFVVMLTDGDDTCSFNANGALKVDATNPSDVAEILFETHDIKTYVVGFGLAGDDDPVLDCNRAGDQLTCMAVKGGTEKPIFPRNKDELVRALNDIFGDVQAESRVFASASLPAVQSTAADKIFFSSFTPIPGSGYWSGRIDVFREPLFDANEPPICRSCSREQLESGCHLFNVGDTILSQAPNDLQIDSTQPDGNVGVAINQRRVFYPPAYVPVDEDGRPAQPIALRLFDLPDLDMPSAAEQETLEDLAQVFIRPAALDGLSLQQKIDRIVPVYRQTLRVKRSLALADAAPCPGQDPIGVPPSYQPGDYLLGDVFHANPLVTSSPNDLRFFRPNICGTPAASDLDNCPDLSGADDEAALATGYRNFTRRGRWNRRMLVTGANDGQLHFFESGIRRVLRDEGDLANPNDDRDVEVFTDGTGVELFSYMPRLTMPIVREQAAADASQIFSVDGTYSIAEVAIDPVFDDDPADGDREWRTVLIGGLREGGDRFDDIRPVDGFLSGYYALDITQPDGLTKVDNEPATARDDTFFPDDAVENGLLPSCLEIESTGLLAASNRTGCESATGERIPFPALKWEFTDRGYYFDTDGDSNDESGWFELDEDLNGFRDLADTWSKPLIGQVPITEIDGTDTTRWVAIVGGGIDAGRKEEADRGNWIYMIDVETGGTLYKRPVDGSVVADVTGLDLNSDGVLDVIYFGTTTGLMYKVDLTQRAPVVPHNVDADQILLWPDATLGFDTERIVDEIWDPFPLFDTQGKSIFFAPALVLVPDLQQYALVFGTGDREDLWEFGSTPGRFVVMVDQDFPRPTSPGGDLPFIEADFINIDFDAPLVGVDADGQPIVNAPDFVTGGHTLSNGSDAAKGWVMRFPVEARTSSRAFALSGVLVFTIFQPDIDPQLQGDEVLCRRTGLSRTFIIDIRNGDALTTLKDLRDPNVPRPGTNADGLVGGSGVGAGSGSTDPTTGPLKSSDCGDRCLERDGFGTAPFVSSIATKNPATSAQTSLADPLASPIMRRLIERLKQEFFPPGCEFNDAFGHMIRMQFDDTGVQNLVPIPIGVCPADWQEGAANWSEDSAGIRRE